MSQELLDITGSPKPLPDLAPIGLVLRDLDVRTRLLDELPGAEAVVATSILQQATQLESGTALDGDVLAEWLGCPVVSIKDFKGLGLEKMQISDRYMSFLLVLQALVETAADKRLLLLGYGHLYPKAGRDVKRLQEAFLKDDPERAFNLLELGEVQAALDTALLALDDKAFRRPRNPFGDLPRVHLSAARLDALIEGRHDLLGAQMVVPRMLEHIHGVPDDGDGCGACSEAYAVRSEQIAAREGEIHTSVSY